MSFREAWARVRTGIVAIVPAVHREDAEFPQVIGTGFLVSKAGVICTCRHVVQEIEKLWVPAGYSGPKAGAVMFRDQKESWGWFTLKIQPLGHVAMTGEATDYRGPDPPDIAYLATSEVTDTPFLSMANESVHEGDLVAFGGFPMGVNLMTAPGWLHQITPTLHSGIVAACLPFQRHPTPHGFVVHANTQGGASGSPVFGIDGLVSGMAYVVARDSHEAEINGLAVPYSVPTSLTLCVSRELIAGSLAGAESDAARLPNRKTLDEHIAGFSRKLHARGDGVLTSTPWPPLGR